MIDAHAFLYFGDGQSVKFHSGRYKPDGGALMIGKAGIEGWWSAPDLKTDVTERASGNGAHDVSADSILYASRTVTVHFDVIGDVHGEVLDAITRVSQANGMPVRLRVVDDRSDTYVSGYVRPEFGATWNARHQTGTLTVVCPRPERLAWSPLQSQLFPVSVMQGGLRYSTVHQLVSAWTGTANASVSTLSKDGTVVATNLWGNPSFADSGSKPSTWQTTVGMAGGSLTVTRLASYDVGTASMPLSSLVSYALGDVIHVRFAIGSSYSGYAPRVQIRQLNSGGYIDSPIIIATVQDGVASADITLNNSNPITSAGVILLLPNGDSTVAQTISISKFMACKAVDHAAMQSLGIDWFSGDSYPVPTGKGLSYPLNYGTGGVASNVALLLNQGSSKAFPVLTVTGNFPNGVQVQCGGNALQYDGAIGGVPLILDSRSQTASMGGVDMSRNLSRRDFPVVPAAGSVSLRLMSPGTGWVTAVCRDTYI